jgi:hypothetical protein
MDRVVITREYFGLFFMQVCAVKDVTDEEILEVCNRCNPCGTSMGWCGVIRKRPEYKDQEPVQCSKYPDRLHFMVNC